MGAIEAPVDHHRPRITFARMLPELIRVTPHGPNRRRYSGDSMKPRTIVFSRKSLPATFLRRSLWKMRPAVSSSFCTNGHSTSWAPRYADIRLVRRTLGLLSTRFAEHVVARFDRRRRRAISFEQRKIQLRFFARRRAGRFLRKARRGNIHNTSRTNHSPYSNKTSTRCAWTICSHGDHAKTVKRPSCDATSARASRWSCMNCAADK